MLEVLILTEAPLNPNSRRISEGKQYDSILFHYNTFPSLKDAAMLMQRSLGDGQGGHLDSFMHLYPVEPMIHSYLANQHDTEE